MAHGLHHVNGSHHVGLECFGRLGITESDKGLRRQVENHFGLPLPEYSFHACGVADVTAQVGLYSFSDAAQYVVVFVRKRV